MGFIKKIGNIPILHERYLVTLDNQLILDAVRFDYIEATGVSNIKKNAIHIRESEWNTGDIMLTIPCKSKVNASLNTNITYEVEKRNTNVDVYLSANSVLNIERHYTYIYLEEYYIFGVALYAPEGFLTGVMICAAEPTNNPDEMRSDPPFRASYVVVNFRYLESLDYEVTMDEESEEFGPASKPDGYGHSGVNPAFDHTSEAVTVPVKPTISVTTAGFYHAYKVTQGLLQNFGAKLFPSISGIVQDITGISSTEDVLKAIANLLFSPTLFQLQQSVGNSISVIDMIINGKAIDYVVDCHVIPVSPSVGGSENIKCGARTLDISAPVITEDYIDFECGTISIPENFQNYIDFHGTRAKLFLVGVGFVDIKPEFWNGGALSVKYRFNILDGSFMCYVSSTSGKSALANTVVGQYGGCMCLHIPVTGVSYASMISGLVTGSMSLAGNIASGNAVGAVGGALTVANTKPSLAQSNNYNSSTAFLGVRRPYLQIERQVPTFSTRYTMEQGLPLNVSMSLNSVSGFTIIEDPRLNLTCDDEEREEIYMLLQKGVIF